MELLNKLTSCYSPSGDECKISEIIINEIKDYVDDVNVDLMGNVIAHKKGDGKKAMICAHMDEIGLMVTFIDDNGFLRFTNVGGIDKFCALYQRVQFANGTIGVVGYEESLEDMKDLKLSKMYIDIGAKDKKDAENKVSIGDKAMFLGAPASVGENCVSKAMDNRAGVYTLIETIKNIKSSVYDLYFVFSSQEEVGLRGAKSSAFDISPDVAIAIDVTDTGDTPNCKPMSVKLVAGPCIKVMDRSVMASKKVKDALIEASKDANIEAQLEVMTVGGTDAGAIQLTKSGVLTGAVSIPTRYIHTPCEMVNEGDIKGASKLVCAFLEKDYIF